MIKITLIIIIIKVKMINGNENKKDNINDTK